MDIGLSTLVILKQKLTGFAKRYRLPLYCLALSAFLLGLYISFQNLDLNWAELSVLPLLAILLVTQPLSTVFNSLELKLCGSAINANITVRDSIQVASTATIANILPLPAGLIVRGGALANRGGSLGDVSKILLIAGLMWIAIAVTVSGAVISAGFVAKTIALAGFVLVLTLIIYISRMKSLKTAMGFFFIRAAMVALLVVQLKLCFLVLGHVVSVQDAAVYVVSGIAGTVISIVPAGLGIIEGFGALLAKLDDVSPALAYIVLSMNRFIGLLNAGIFAFLFSTTSRPVLSGTET